MNFRFTEFSGEGEGDDLRVREPLERLVAHPVRVEQRVGIVDETEEDGQDLFRLGELLGLAHNARRYGHPLPSGQPTGTTPDDCQGTYHCQRCDDPEDYSWYAFPPIACRLQRFRYPR